MSTPPPYPFRSRREIHSGEPKVYSDAPHENASGEAPPALVVRVEMTVLQFHPSSPPAFGD